MTTVVVAKNPDLNRPISILALGIISSCLVLAIIQPPASILLTSAILIVTIANILPKNGLAIRKPYHIFENRFFEKPIRYEPIIIYNEPKYLARIAQRTDPRFEPPREPVGRRDLFAERTLPRMPNKLPVQSACENERVPVGSR